MQTTVWLKMLGASATVMALVACGSVEVEVDEEPKEEVKPEPKPEPKKKAPPAGPGMKVEDVNAKREEMVGKTVTVSGFYTSTTKQGNPVEQLNIGVRAAPGHTQDDGSKTPEVLCVASPDNEAMFDGMKMEDPITVSGTVDEKAFFDNAMLKDCVVSKGDAAAPKEGGAKKGKKGKRKKKKK